MFQALYARSVIGKDFTAEALRDDFFTEEEYAFVLDEAYFKEMFDGIIRNEHHLRQIITELAPKFSVESMPLCNVLLLFVGIYEMVFYRGDEIPANVSINEALNLGNEFSDEPSRMMINGTLNSVKNRLEALKQRDFTQNTEPNLYF